MFPVEFHCPALVLLHILLTLAQGHHALSQSHCANPSPPPSPSHYMSGSLTPTVTRKWITAQPWNNACDASSGFANQPPCKTHIIVATAYALQFVAQPAPECWIVAAMRRECWSCSYNNCEFFYYQNLLKWCWSMQTQNVLAAFHRCAPNWFGRRTDGAPMRTTNMISLQNINTHTTMNIM